MLDDATLDPEDATVVHQEVKGRWKIVNGALVIHFAEKVDDEDTWEGGIEEGHLALADRKFVDEPFECGD